MTIGIGLLGGACSGGERGIVDAAGYDAGSSVLDAGEAGTMVDSGATPDAATRSDAGVGDAGVRTATDGGLDAALGCSNASECDDGRFRNGEERCRAGRCVAGTQPVLDDEIGCTIDRCDEEADAVIHAADGTTCPADGPRCAEGELTTSLPICDPSTGCGMVTTVGSCPVAASQCIRGGTAHRVFLPACADSTSCDPTRRSRTTECPAAPPDNCVTGQLTVHAQLCDDMAGCDISSVTSTCPTPTSFCSSDPLQHTRFEPICSDSSRCSSAGRADTTSCTTPPSECVDNVYTTYRATCDDTTGCNSVVRTANDCDALRTSSCLDEETLSITEGSCNASGTERGCVVSERRRSCVEWVCVSETASSRCTGCLGNGCTGCTVLLCGPGGCNPATGRCR